MYLIRLQNQNKDYCSCHESLEDAQEHVRLLKKNWKKATIKNNGWKITEQQLQAGEATFTMWVVHSA